MREGGETPQLNLLLQFNICGRLIQGRDGGERSRFMPSRHGALCKFVELGAGVFLLYVTA